MPVRYFTEHGDDAPQVDPLADLYKSQVWVLAAHLGVPSEVLERAPSAGLEPGQTDERDFGLDYGTIDTVLSHLEGGYDDSAVRGLGIGQVVIDEVRRRVRESHRKRLGALFPSVQPSPPDVVQFFRPHGGSSV